MFAFVIPLSTVIDSNYIEKGFSCTLYPNPFYFTFSVLEEGLMVMVGKVILRVSIFKALYILKFMKVINLKWKNIHMYDMHYTYVTYIFGIFP